MAGPLRVPFRALRGDKVLRPYLLVRVPFRQSPQSVPAIVDSGADGSSLPLFVARGLRVRFESDGLLVRGAGGVHREFSALGRVSLQTDIGPVFLSAPTVNPNLPFILLGRDDFFAAYRVCFDQRRLVMELERR